jgi:hypothetical protein
MSELKKLSMSELIARYNAIASSRGIANVTEFKNLAAARAAVTQLEEGKTMTETVTTTTEGSAAPATDAKKYSSAGKRGPNQGVGEFAKNMIRDGADNKSVLEAIKTQFPEAKTTMGCVAYYRAAVKNPAMGKKGGKSAEQLRADAQAILAKAEALEAAAKAKASAEAAATAAPV